MPENLRRTFPHRLLLWISLWGLYLVSSGEADVQEMVAGALVSSAVTAITVRARSHGEARFLPRWRWLLPFLKIPPTMIQESWLLLRALCRQIFRGDFPGGGFIEYGLHPAQEKEDLSPRLGITTIGVCLTPNDYVVSIDEERMIARVRILVGRKLSGADTAFLELR